MVRVPKDNKRRSIRAEYVECVECEGWFPQEHTEKTAEGRKCYKCRESE